jgi:hypothetical protein
MLRANDIVPQNPEPLEPQVHTLDTLPTSSGKGEPRVKKEGESRAGSETDDEDSIREKALLVRLRFHVVNYCRFIIYFARLKSRDARLRLRESGMEDT